MILKMENSHSSFLWNSQPLAALHQMTEMNSANFLRMQQQSFMKSGLVGAHINNASSSASPPLGAPATPHGINDILNRNINPAVMVNAANSLSMNQRLFFNPQNVNMNMMVAAAGNKNFSDLRSLYQWLPGSMAKAPNHQQGHDSGGPGNEDCRDRRNKKNTRPTFTGHQIFLLEKTFESTKYLAGPDRAKLAFTLGMSESQVKVWFQNRRTKHRKKQSAENAVTRGHKGHGDNEERMGCDSDSKSESDQ